MSLPIVFRSFLLWSNPLLGIKSYTRQGTSNQFTELDIPKDTEEILEGETFVNIDEYNQIMECFLNLSPLADICLI
jgi:hypothetical protein